MPIPDTDRRAHARTDTRARTRTRTQLCQLRLGHNRITDAGMPYLIGESPSLTELRCTIRALCHR